MCCTTFQITLAARELVLEAMNASRSAGDTYESTNASVEAAAKKSRIRIAGHNWKEYGANMKAWYNDFVVSDQ